ncbi:hypothetical protein MKW92_012595, partial [Papaver armeniacum]
YTDDMELEDATHTAILTLKEGYSFTYFCIFSPGKKLAFTWRVHLIIHMFTLRPYLYALTKYLVSGSASKESVRWNMSSAKAALESDTRESVFLLAN